MRTKTLVLTLALALSSLPLAASAGSLLDNTEAPSGDELEAQASAKVVGSREGSLPLGAGTYHDQQLCRYIQRCADQQEISLIDVEVASIIDQAPPGKRLKFFLEDTGDFIGAQTSVFQVCFHKANNALLGCYSQSDYGVFGNVPNDANSARVLLRQGVERPFELSLWH